MENASKALIIAAAALIAILILTLAVYLFSSMSENAAEMYKELEASEITRFNQQFLNYDGRGIVQIGFKDNNGNGRKDADESYIYNPLTIQEVATIVNLAVDNKKLPKMPTEIKVEITGCGCINGEHEDCAEEYKNNINDFLKDHILDVQSGKKFKCSVHTNIETMLIDKVEINEMNE